MHRRRLRRWGPAADTILAAGDQAERRAIERRGYDPARSPNVFATDLRAWPEHHVCHSENEDKKVNPCHEETTPCPIAELSRIMPGLVGQRDDTTPLWDKERPADRVRRRRAHTGGDDLKREGRADPYGRGEDVERQKSFIDAHPRESNRRARVCPLSVAHRVTGRVRGLARSAWPLRCHWSVALVKHHHQTVVERLEQNYGSMKMHSPGHSSADSITASS